MNCADQLREQLRSHLDARYPVLYLVSPDDDGVDEVIRDLQSGERALEWNLARGLVHFDSQQPMGVWSDLPDALENLIEDDALDHVLLVIRDAHHSLRDQPKAVARLKALVQGWMRRNASSCVLLVSPVLHVPVELEKLIKVFEVPLPDASDIVALIQDVAQNESHNERVDVDPEEALLLAHALQGLTRVEIKQLVRRGYQQDGMIGREDLKLIQHEKQQLIRKSGILETVQVKESLDEIGGLLSLKSWLQRKARVVNEWEQARRFGVEAPKGFMVVGMPGCGKSLTAKATACLFDLPMLKLDMGALMGKYVGESEGNMRRALQVAEAVSPCVLWVDEIEKAFVGVGSGGGGSEVATRLFGYFLTWMQEKTKQVFVVGTANDITNLPPELLRKGRFDEIFFVDFPTEAERKAIFEVHLRRFGRPDSTVDTAKLAGRSSGYSGADVESVVKEAIELAFVEGRATLDTALLLRVIDQTTPLSQVMGDKVDLSKKRFESLKIKPAA